MKLKGDSCFRVRKGHVPRLGECLSAAWTENGRHRQRQNGRHRATEVLLAGSGSTRYLLQSLNRVCSRFSDRSLSLDQR